MSKPRYTRSEEPRNPPGGWSEKVFFLSYTDNGSLEDVSMEKVITHDQLRFKLNEIANDNEAIKSIAMYKIPLSGWLLGGLYWYRHIVILETSKWWWSIEKNSEGLTVQRSENKYEVLRKYRNKQRFTNYRNADKLLIEDKGHTERTVSELIGWLYFNRTLKENESTTNDTQFCQNLFNRFAEKKSYGTNWF